MSRTDLEALFAQVPSAAEAPPAPLPSRVARRPEGPSRRTVLTAVAGAAVASGLSVFDLFPWSKPRGALAAAYQQWSDCRGYFSNTTTVCVPTTAFYDDRVCKNTWHRDEVSSGPCYHYVYEHAATTCDGRNAWRWTAQPTKRKCSDGWIEYWTCGGGQHPVSRFSICRTPI